MAIEICSSTTSRRSAPSPPTVERKPASIAGFRRPDIPRLDSISPGLCKTILGCPQWHWNKSGYAIEVFPTRYSSAILIVEHLACSSTSSWLWKIHSNFTSSEGLVYWTSCESVFDNTSAVSCIWLSASIMCFVRHRKHRTFSFYYLPLIEQVWYSVLLLRV